MYSQEKVFLQKVSENNCIVDVLATGGYMTNQFFSPDVSMLLIFYWFDQLTSVPTPEPPPYPTSQLQSPLLLPPNYSYSFGVSFVGNVLLPILVCLQSNQNMCRDERTFYSNLDI